MFVQRNEIDTPLIGEGTPSSTSRMHYNSTSSNNQHATLVKDEPFTVNPLANATKAGMPIKWDLCIVLPNPENFIGQQLKDHLSLEEIEKRLRGAGLETAVIKCDATDVEIEKEREIYIFVGATLKNLKEHAEAIKLPLLVNTEFIGKQIDKTWAPIQDEPEVTRIHKYEHFYYEYHNLEGMYCVSLYSTIVPLNPDDYLLFCM